MFKRIKKRIPFAYYPYKPFMHKNACIFIHIPKNAGSSILKLFGDEGGRKHAKWYDFYESNDYFFQRYVKFAIVREPISRLFSAYNYCINGGNHSAEDIKLKEVIEKSSNNFDAFVEHILSYDFLMMQPLFLPQYLYIYDREFNCKVDTVLKYESLLQDWKFFSEKYNFPMSLPHENRALSQKTDFHMLDKTKHKIRELYHFDFSLFDY